MRIELLKTRDMTREDQDAILALCGAAYDEDLRDYLANIGPGLHLLGRVDGELVSHVMFVERTLEIVGTELSMRTAYVELVATHPLEQHRGYASQLLREIVKYMDGYDIAALSPTDSSFYARLGWEPWLGKLAIRTKEGLFPSPDEEIMILRLAHTPIDLNIRTMLSIEWRPGEVW
jgi:aminoglycoside 2'-N-acetyltransferase I